MASSLKKNSIFGNAMKIAFLHKVLSCVSNLLKYTVLSSFKYFLERPLKIDFR